MKKRILTAFAIVFVIALFPVLLPFALSVEADGETSSVPSFTMDVGAAVRITDGDDSGSDCGIRYSYTLASDEYEALKNSETLTDVKFGVFIAAASYNVDGKEIADESHVSGVNAIYYWKVSETEDGENVYNVTPTDGMRRIICAEGDAMRIESDGKAHFYGSVVGMKDSNLRRAYIGVGYIKYVENGETHYKFATAADNVRTMEQIARIAYERETSLREKLVKIYLGKTARDCTVTTAPAAIENLVETGEDQVLVTAGVADEYSEMNYSLDGETFGAEIPEAAEAGTYTVYYKAKSLTSFDRDSEVNSVTVVIAEQQSNVLTLKPATITEIKDNETLVGFNGTYDYKGLGEYNVGDVLEFKFKGQNIPNVGLFVNKNGVNAIGGGTENTGIFLQTSGHGTVTYNKRLYITGPYLVDAGSADAYSNISGFNYRQWLGANKELGVDTSYAVDGGKFSHFGIEMLDENTDYIYRVTTTEGSSASNVVIKVTLYSVVNDVKTTVAVFSKSVTHYLDSLENRYAVVYGMGDFYSKNENKYTGKSITFEYAVNPIESSGELTLQPASIKESAVDGKTYFSGTYDYKGLGNYALGDTLEFKFKGKNIPNVGLFVNKFGVNPVGGGTENTGLFIQTSGHTETFNRRLYVVGPFLLDAGSIEPYESIQTGYTWKNELGKNMELGVDVSNGDGTSPFGISMLDDNTDYIYTISTAASATTGNVKITIVLGSVTDGVITQVCEYAFDRPCYMTDFTNKYAIVYGAGDAYNKSITFSYEVKKAA